MSGTETKLVHAVVQYLRLRGYMAWRNNSGAMGGVYKGKRRYVRFSTPGASDVFAVQPVTGRFVAVECKVGSGRLKPKQAGFLDEVRAQGGIGIVAYTLDDVDDALKVSDGDV